MKRLVFDIGGSNLRLGVAEDGKLGVHMKIPVPADPQDALAAIRDFLAAEDFTPEDAVGSIAGTIADGVVVRPSNNLPGWEGFNFSDALVACGISSVRVANDAEMAGLAEAREGAGKGHTIVAYLAVGTGVGGTLVVGGETAPATEGIEPGKQIIDYASARSLESLTGGAALAEEFGAPVSKLPRSVYEERTRALASGIYNLVRIWSPDIFVLNGSVVNDESGFRLTDLNRELLALAGEVPMPPLVRATFGDESGLTGAALL